jgi:glycosyltransferase involved in cell wall biosynthesis
MTKWLFLGPVLLSGIGQVTKHYSDAVDGDYYIYGSELPQKSYDVGFVFLLPMVNNMLEADKFAKICKKMIYMTVCETDTVDDSYKTLEKYQPMYVPSEFCKNILNNQFPNLNCKILRHYVPLPPPPPLPAKSSSPYIFYTIGNIIDPRKNIENLVKAFQECNFPDAQLLIKATCNRPVRVNAPNVTMITQYLTTEQIQKIHQSCHCYVNCSHSEGVGMGAVEAALHNKPVIITNYGGLQEYVKTPFIINAPKDKIGFDDFLFKKDMVWGQPQFEDIVKCLKECYEQRLTHWDHEHTKILLTQVPNNLNNIE